jgi:hypothetical protein
MKSKKLNYFVNIIANWNDKSTDIRNELYFLDSSIFLKSIDQFEKELGENTSALPIKKKRERIKVYIQRFNEALSISQGNEFNQYHSISFDNWNVKNDKKNKDPNPSYSFFEKIVHQLLIMIFNHIQFSCWRNDVPFIEMCEEEGFPTKKIDLAISLPHKQGWNVNLYSLLYGPSPKVLSISEMTNPTETIINNSQSNKSISGPLTESDLKRKLKEAGFYNLKMVKDLPDQNLEKLLDLLFYNDAPYRIAMLVHLEFIREFGKECITKKELNKRVGIILSVTDRFVEGNINVLSPISKENKKLYTSHIHKEKVKEDFEKLK